MITPDLSQFSMQDLFRAEAESQTQALTSGLLALERSPTAADHLEACMRAAHSLKGSVANFGASAAVAAALRLEQMGRAQQLVEAPEALRALEQALSKVCAELTAL